MAACLGLPSSTYSQITANLNKNIQSLYFWPQAAKDVLTNLFNISLWRNTSHNLENTVDIAEDFIGINIATSEDPLCDDYLLDRLQELKIRHVRMDFSYCSFNSYAERLLNRLIEENYAVMLDLLPPLAEAEMMLRDVAVQDRWRAFIGEVFHVYGQTVEIFEIGNTPNRGRWSGFDARGYLQAWEIACQESDKYQLQLAGPNISDFEPLYNTLFLSSMARITRAPEIHTDNLFVERVIEPEAYDHRVLGRWASKLLRLNLVKKARILQRIGDKYNIQKTICTYKCWTTKRLNRLFDSPQDKKADYLIRYLVLATVSGSLSRVYWGPLICSRDGLIDDQTEDYPDIDQVSFYREVRGKVDDFIITPSFHALKFVVAKLRNTRCLNAFNEDNGLSHFVFKPQNGEQFHLCWCRDGLVLPLSYIYTPEQLTNAIFSDASGQQLFDVEVASEHPLIIEFSESSARQIPDRKTLRGIPNLYREHTVFLSSSQWQSTPWHNEHWQGAFTNRRENMHGELGDSLSPSQLVKMPELQVLRDARNRLWNIEHPFKPGQHLTVKLNRVRGLKRLSYRFQSSKGKRHWNTACEMLHRGVKTPTPIAFYERHNNSGVENSYYICDFLADAYSARQVFAAFRQGEDLYRGLNKQQWFDKLTAFISNMHNHRIIHRDLSVGNLLLQEDDEGQTQPYVIDIGRASCGHKRQLSARQRLKDLMRICYKLDWSDRELFMASYCSHSRKISPIYWRLALLYYDIKQGGKKGLKGHRKKRHRVG